MSDTAEQRITKLTPLSDVVASFDLSIGPVEPREAALQAAHGLTLAASVSSATAQPPMALALRDGFALRADATLDASSYAPTALSPAPQRVSLGTALPPGADAVARIDDVSVTAGCAEVRAAVAPGDGVLAMGADAAAGAPLRLAGARLRRMDVALLTGLGIERVLIRQPQVRLVRVATGPTIEAISVLLASAIDNESGRALEGTGSLDQVLEAPAADMVVAIGGTGAGPNDRSVATLARMGTVAFHGIGITPGETTAVGAVGDCPVLLLPGRFDAALAGWLTIGRRMLARRAFRLIEEQPFAAELGRKVASPLGLAEVVAVRRRLGRVEPVASGYLSLQALANSEGWILVPPDSEGHAPGSRVVVRPWP